LAAHGLKKAASISRPTVPKGSVQDSSNMPANFQEIKKSRFAQGRGRDRNRVSWSALHVDDETSSALLGRMLCPQVNRSHLHSCLLSSFFFLKIAGKLRINPASPLAFVTLAASIQSALRSTHDRMTVTEIAAIRAKVDSPPKKVDTSEKYALLAYATNTESVIFPARFAVKNRQNGNLIIPIGTMYTSSGSGVIERQQPNVLN